MKDRITYLKISNLSNLGKVSAAPSFVTFLLQMTQSIHITPAANSSLYVAPKRHRSFVEQSAKDWNSLPPNTNNANSLFAFKRLYLTHLLHIPEPLQIFSVIFVWTLIHSWICRTVSECCHWICAQVQYLSLDNVMLQLCILSKWVGK